MTPDEFANKLCAEMIRQGVLTEDNAVHHALHKTAKALFEESCEAAAEKSMLEQRYGGDPFKR